MTTTKGEKNEAQAFVLEPFFSEANPLSTCEVVPRTFRNPLLEPFQISYQKDSISASQQLVISTLR